MSRPDSLGSRFTVEFVGQLAATVAGGLLTILLARLLGPDEYGLLFLAIAVFGSLGILSKLGIAKSGARYIAEYKERRPEQIPHIIRTTAWYNLLAIAVVGTALVVGHRHLARVIGEPSLTPFLLLGALYLALEASSTYVRLILQGFEQIKVSAAVHALDRVSRLAFAVGLVVLGFGALGALAGYLLSFAFASAVGIGFLYVRQYRPLDTGASIEDGLRRRIGSYTVPLTATSTANTLDKKVDTILVGFFLSPVAVSYYVLSKQIVQFVETPMSALGFTLSPTFGAEKASDNIERAARLYETSLVYSLLLYVPVGAGIVLVAEPTVSLLVGQEYLGAVPVLQVLAAYAVLQAVTNLTSNGLDYLGRARSRAVVKGTTAALNVVLNVLLIPTLGVVGAAIATVITYSMYTLANVYIIHQEFSLRLGYLVRRLVAIGAITGIMALTVAAVTDYITSIPSLLLVVGLGVVVWGALSVATGLLDIADVRSTLQHS
ncbi:flippase [Natronosalvus rutilus]|uniref:Flippase n=1 Tax=Natronosalvus rutilus TaxID=2953753 RepID=A0A9E7STX1_9EURY|nr:flippase [Natronosalvus rutilus]UTF52960.1 flippase [Natronosalvus rutilus]